MSGEPIIRVRGLRNSFGDQVVHDDLNLDVERGEILASSAARAPASRC
jgi:phospholipid/cholesterol/gamma-HCH transport system ATP-binding protein